MRSLLLLLSPLLVATAACANESVWRPTVTLPADPSTIGALDAFVIADQLGEHALADSILDREDWPEHLREWCRAREAARRGDMQTALDLQSHAASIWPADDGEPELVLAIFDEQWLELALQLGDLERAQKVALSPLRPHHHGVWRALRARVDLASGDPGAALEKFERAWEQADELERRHPAFVHGAVAALAAGDTEAAVDAWQRSVDVLRRPERLRVALEIWDRNPGLRTAVESAADARPTLEFLVRALRREEARDIQAKRLSEGLDDPVAGALFIAEQNYRLRDHDALRAWLESTPREDWGADEQAQAEGYRWGMERRGGTSLEVARGFDELAERWEGTGRAAEAWWEAAWMYELSDEPELAAERYARHVRASRGGRFRSSAALRTILLPLRESDDAAALQAWEQFGDDLGEGMDQAAAWWLLGHRAGEDIPERLREEHPGSPFWRGLAPELGAGSLPSPVEIARTQAEAFAVISRSLGEDSLQELPDDLAAIARVAELGLRTEAQVRLDDWARTHGSDDGARLRAVWVAWRFGLSEVQGRHGWFLERRLGGEDPALDRALRTVGLPTPYVGTVHEIAAGLDLPPALIWALVRRESFFDADVVSLAGAHGLMQLMPATADRVADDLGMDAPSSADLFVPRINLRLGSAYLAALREEASGNWVRALASYNAGEWNGERWEARLRDGEDPALGILLISYTETRSYVYNVLRLAHLYEDLWRAGI